jgi:hypothetical protein
MTGFAAILVFGAGLVMANKANVGEGICITVAPNMLVLSSEDTCVSVHSNIPFSAVDPGSILLEGIEPYLVKADDCGDLVVKVDRAAVKAIAVPGEMTLTLTGILIDEGPFAASDTIMVKE